MTGILDSGPGSLATMATAIVFVVRLAVAVAKRWRATQDKAMSEVPPSPQLAPPGPDVDAAVLARLQRLEEHDVLTTALAQSERRVDSLEELVQDLRRQVERLNLQLNAERAVAALRASLLSAKDERIVRLEEDLARERTRSRGGAIEVAAEREHRDASQAGPLADGLPTPLRPPPKG